ncbi:hypothetical protein MNEG_6172 [Monoraphidium neglectum]|uniref:PLAC8 family protein n=1 Tax=Monoraphidium neglectum TaxID=145388 RepID=A0A0D2L3K9_9CHLO|nr:hypothetical protein MNEG_6172 [Monoraphidium neglectum]KIZ01789.1 hypothetical protein MNEG_6172 [Monoraphidium neglectum]|eukprot:XP_013900808.1 hypothetical protein MNEG_6172 [Monoraphidium neglectum]
MTAGRYEKMEARAGYARQWKEPLHNPCAKPGFCCYAMLCGYCASYQAVSAAPSSAPCLQVFLCFAQSVASTRFMIQDELSIQNTQCDNCIIGTMICAQYLACICSLAACLTGSDEINDIAQVLDCIADVLWCSVCACIQVQHKVELDARDSGGRGGAPAPTQAPGLQQIQMGGAYAPGGAYGPGGAYPPGGGYPAQGVPMGYPQQPGAMYR